MPHKPSLSGLPHVKTVIRRGKEYHYFNTGQRVNGKPVYKRLPDKDDDNFGRAYAAAKASRTKRANAPNMMTVEQLGKLWERGPLKKRSQGTQKTYLFYLAKIYELFENVPAAGVEARDIYMMMDKKADKPAAAQMMFLVAKLIFQWGKKRHHIPHDPTAEVEPEQFEGSEHEPWHEDLLEAALQDEAQRLPVALLYYTAQRIGDVCAMRWNDIKDDVIHITQQKTGKDLQIPLHSRLRAILAETPKRGITILADERGKPARVATVRERIKRWGAKHGVNIVPHGLRKNAVNALLEAGCSTGEVSSISGQSLALVEFYAKKRNNARLGKAAILKWQRSGGGEA